MLLHGIIQRILKVVLDVGVDGQPQAAAFQRHFLGLVALFQRIAPGIHRRQHHAVVAGEHIIILQLQPAHPGVVHIGEAQHRRQKFPLRVPAFGVLIDADAGDAVRFAEVPHGVGGVPLHPVAQKAVVGSAVAEFFQQLCFIQFQYLRKALGRQLQLVGGHLAGRGPQGPAAAVGRQQHAVGTVDAAPVGGDHGVPQLLAEGAVGVPAAGKQLQIQKPCGQPRKADTAHQYGHQPCPGAEGPLRQGAQGTGRWFRLWHGRHLLMISRTVYAPAGRAYD